MEISRKDRRADWTPGAQRGSAQRLIASKELRLPGCGSPERIAKPASLRSQWASRQEATGSRLTSSASKNSDLLALRACCRVRELLRKPIANEMKPVSSFF